MTPRADDNWLQRRYFAWAEPHYQKMPPRTRAEVERIDRWLYSRRSVGIWAAFVVAIVASSLGLYAAGLPTLLAIAASLVFWTSLPLAVLGAWLQPERFTGKQGPAHHGCSSSVALPYLGAAGRLSHRPHCETRFGLATR